MLKFMGYMLTNVGVVILIGPVGLIGLHDHVQVIIIKNVHTVHVIIKNPKKIGFFLI